MIHRADTILSLLERRIKRRTKDLLHQYSMRSNRKTFLAQTHTHDPPEEDLEACPMILDSGGSPAGDGCKSAAVGLVTAGWKAAMMQKATAQKRTYMMKID